MTKLLFEIIITNQCNKRCDYCDLDFRSNYISEETINSFYKKYKQSEDKFESLYINFFWGEPLLNFDMIKYCVELFWSEKNIKFSVWTNWALLDEDKLGYLLKNDIEIYLSLDYDNVEEILHNNLILGYKEIININFILQPRKIFLLKDKLDDVLQVEFKSFNIMPVYTTQKWYKNELWELVSISKWILESYENRKVTFFTYFKWATSEQQFILDTDWSIYKDIDSLLWLQKQYSIIPKKLKDLIHTVSYSWKIAELDVLAKICDNYGSYNLEAVIKAIPRVTWNEEINSKIENIFVTK